MNLNDKIKQILVDKSISPSHFADEIGVQRSSISHILAGRNRPSLDIVQKIILRYPDLGMEWILEDDEFSAPTSNSKPYPSQVKAENSPVIPTKRNGSDLPVQKVLPQDPLQTIPEAVQGVPSEDKSVERILIFYTDGTFKQYIPE